MQQQAGHRLVDAALDRTRVVVDRHAEFAQRVQHAEALRDLLETAAGDAAHQHRIGQLAAEARQRQAVPRQRSVDSAVGQVDAAADSAALAQRGLQLARVPADLVGHDRNTNQLIHHCCNSAMSMPPA
jgi:hypothetical protein